MFDQLINKIGLLFNENKINYNLWLSRNKIKLITDKSIIEDYKNSLKIDSLFKDNIKSLEKDIETLKYLYLFTIKNNNITFKIYLIIHKKQNFNYQIYQIINIISSLFYLNNLDLQNQIINIYLYLYDKPRTLYNQDLNDKSINGLTKSNRFICTCGYTSSRENKIIITRLNHFTGLLIHELLHLFNVDEKDNDFDITNEWERLFYNLISNKTKPGYFFEGINNFKACIINMTIKHYLFDKSIDILSLFKIEYYYSYLLCCKLIKFFNCSNYQDMIKNNKFEQNGSLFEYSFIKFMFLSNVDYFDENLKLIVDKDKIIKTIKNFNFDLSQYNKINNLFIKFGSYNEIVDYYFN